MQTGQAVWNIVAILQYLAVKPGTDPATLRLLEFGQESCKQLAEHTGINLPTSAELNNYTQYFDTTFFPAVSKRTAAPEPDASEVSHGPLHPSVEEAIELSQAILSGCALLEDVQEASEFAESVSEKADSMLSWIKKNERVSEKMLTSLRNMKGGMDKWLAKLQNRPSRIDDPCSYRNARDDDGDYNEDIPF